MITVYKYEFPEEMQMNNTYGRFTMKVPSGFVPLKADVQNNRRVVWCEVDTENVLERRTFLLVGTGKEISNKDEWEYINTFYQDGFVWHLYLCYFA